MNKLLSTTALSTPAVLRTLDWVRKQGFLPVPLVAGKKKPHPTAGKGYADADWQPPADDLWHGGDYGLGLVTGPARGGPLDVDLDCEEAIYYADQFFPHTRAVFGREGKPRSHRLYRIKAGSFAKRAFVDPITKAVMLELRGDAHQTVLPGNLHEGTGQPINWSEGEHPDVDEIEEDECVDAAVLTAMAILIDRHMWHEGARNDPNMAIGALLLERGWTLEKVKLLIGTVMERLGDKDRSRFKSLDRTAKKLEAGEGVASENKLRELLGPEAGKAVTELAKLAGGDRVSIFPDLFNNGRPRPTIPNTVVALRELGIEVRYDLFKQREMVSGHALAEFAGDVQDPALHRLRELVHERFRFHPGREVILDAVHTIGNHHRFHPVQDYLYGLEWDGVSRIDRWLIDYGGAEDTPFIRAVGAIFLVAAVRRIREPGCKFDEILVLESEQGKLKSSALETMAVLQDWFTDNSPLGRSDKEVIETLSGHWIVEIAELKGMNNSAIENVKAFASRRVDRARMSYQITVSTVPRQCVFFATTNDEQYLRDQTGNRRFWPVRIEKFDIERLLADRDQLWAEAAAREAMGSSIRLPEPLWAAAAEQQAARMVENPFVTELDELLREPKRLVGTAWQDGAPLEGKVSTRELMAALDLPPGRQSQRHIEQVAAAMKELGWRRPNKDGRLRFAGPKPIKAWVKGEGPEFRPITIEPGYLNEERQRIPATAYYSDKPPPSGIPGQD